MQYSPIAGIYTEVPTLSPTKSHWVAQIAFLFVTLWIILHGTAQDQTKMDQLRLEP